MQTCSVYKQRPAVPAHRLLRYQAAAAVSLPIQLSVLGPRRYRCLLRNNDRVLRNPAPVLATTLTSIMHTRNTARRITGNPRSRQYRAASGGSLAITFPRGALILGGIDAIIVNGGAVEQYRVSLQAVSDGPGRRVTRST